MKSMAWCLQQIYDIFFQVGTFSKTGISVCWKSLFGKNGAFSKSSASGAWKCSSQHKRPWHPGRVTTATAARQHATASRRSWVPPDWAEAHGPEDWCYKELFLLRSRHFTILVSQVGSGNKMASNLGDVYTSGYELVKKLKQNWDFEH